MTLMLSQRRPFSLLLALLVTLALIPLPAFGATSSFAWSTSKTVVLGVDGGLMAPALEFASGRTGLEGSTSDLVVEQNLPDVYLYSNAGVILDLGAVDFGKVPPLSGAYTRKVTAVVNHVYLVQTGKTIAKVKVVRVVTGERQYSMPAVTIEYSTGPFDPAEQLPDASSVDLTKPVEPTKPAEPSTPDTPQVPTPAPTADVLKASVRDGKVVLTWSAFATPNDGYYIFRSAAAGRYGDPTDDFPQPGLTYTDAKVQVGQTYFYVVKAYKDGAYTQTTNELSVTVTPAPLPEPVPAPNPGTKVRRTVRLVVDNSEALVDGKPVRLDVPPTVIDNRTVVPLRFVADALGAELKWDGAERKIILTGSHTVVLWVDKTRAQIDGKETELDVAPTIINGRTMVPLRFASTNLGADLTWNAADRSIELSVDLSQEAADRFWANQQPQPKSEPQPEPKPQPEPEKPTPAPSDVVGSWRCMSYAGNFCPVGWHLNINADGTYTMGAESGTYSMVDGKIKLHGGFPEKWSAGEFYYDNSPKVTFTITIDGWAMYVVFARE
jgi:hypothetical protein